MSNILNSDDFGSKLYNKFPIKYREDDADQNYALKRFLQALSDGGFKYAIDEINGITDLINPDKVDSKVLPILFKQYGLEVFNGIPEDYLRYLLPKIGEAFSKKGSLGVVEFISSSISGVKTSTKVTYDSKDNPLIDVVLEMDYNLGGYFPDVEQFNRLLKSFVPFYCDMILVYSYLFHETQVIKPNDTYQFMNVTDLKTEDTNLLGDITFKDKTSLVSSDSFHFHSEDDNSDFPSTFYKDVGKLKNDDENSVIEFAMTEHESAGIKETHETLNDVVNENVQSEVARFTQFGEYLSLTNNESHLLNTGFYTNTFNYCDIITQNGKVEVIFN